MLTLIDPKSGEMTTISHVGIESGTVYITVQVAERNNSYIARLISIIGQSEANNVINFASEFKKGTLINRSDH